MKKLFLTLAAAALTLTAMADEGMWLLPYLQKMNIKDMKAKGLKLSAEDIYSVNKSSLKDTPRSCPCRVYRFVLWYQSRM